MNRSEIDIPDKLHSIIQLKKKKEKQRSACDSVIQLSK
jgi:hypothetical protein